MKTILITSGPVHEHLDDVKIITNKFRGGRIASLAERIINDGIPDLSKEECTIDKSEISLVKLSFTGKPFLSDTDELFNKCLYKVIYLCSKGTTVPDFIFGSIQSRLLQVVYHNGFNDYYEKVKKYSKEAKAVVLGAAVCNLIPVEPIRGKFPSHNYKPNDVIPINFKIAPRVVDMVKQEAPKAHLFAFKLLSGVKHEELIDAAYDIALESKATAVIANDLIDLNQKYIVTKEKGVLKYTEQNYHEFILNSIENYFYRTFLFQNILTPVIERYGQDKVDDSLEKLRNKIDILKDIYDSKFQKTYGKEEYVFGTIAVIDRKYDIMMTTARGKKDFSVKSVFDVTHNGEKVYAPIKVSLNAPLLAYVFEWFPESTAIVHYHDFDAGLPELPYELPGTKKDSIRNLSGCKNGFVIKGHGTFIILY